MKLVLAVVQDADASALLRGLAAHSFEATRLASTGGFLREGNTTLMIGVSDDRLDALRRLVQQSCRTRTRLVAASLSGGEQAEGMVTEPLEVAVGGAVMFVMAVEECSRV